MSSCRCSARFSPKTAAISRRRTGTNASTLARRSKATLNPYEHGECYVTVDGHEADLDLGHYERFLGIQTTKANNITTGRIYKSVIDKERRGDYFGSG